MDAVEFASLRVPAELKAAVCNPADVACADPVASEVTPGVDGFVEFTVQHGFEGYLEFLAPNIVPSLAFNNQPWLENTTSSGPALVTHKILADIYERAGRPTNDDRGLAVLEIRDCNNNPGDGVSFEAVEDEQPFYFDGALPTRELDRTVISTLLAANREERAVGGFSNIPSGIRTFRVNIAGTNRQMIEYTMSIRPGYISYARLYPQWR